MSGSRLVGNVDEYINTNNYYLWANVRWNINKVFRNVLLRLFVVVFAELKKKVLAILGLKSCLFSLTRPTLVFHADPKYFFSSISEKNPNYTLL